MQQKKERKSKKCRVSKGQHLFIKSTFDPKYEVCQHCGHIRLKEISYTNY